MVVTANQSPSELQGGCVHFVERLCLEVLIFVMIMMIVDLWSEPFMYGSSARCFAWVVLTRDGWFIYIYIFFLTTGDTGAKAI